VMRLEDQVPSRELCQRLKELGMPQETYFSWRGGTAGRETQDEPWVHATGDYLPEAAIVLCAAPTVAELGEMLPESYFRLRTPGFSREWEFSKTPEEYGRAAKTEADARAEVLIWCAENGLVRWK
jgi:hypothetical protein